MVALGLHYLPTFILAAIACLLAGITIRRRTGSSFDSGVLTAIFFCLPMAAWLTYLGLTFKSTMTLILLDSESAGVAEIAYNTRFNNQMKTLDQAVALAVNSHQPPNVRFYAACLLADKLAKADSALVEVTLARIRNAPGIQTQFIGRNHITELFYVPGRLQPYLTPAEIVERRLHFLRKTGHVQGSSASSEPPKDVPIGSGYLDNYVSSGNV